MTVRSFFAHSSGSPVDARRSSLRRSAPEAPTPPPPPPADRHLSPHSRALRDNTVAAARLKRLLSERKGGHGYGDDGGGGAATTPGGGFFGAPPATPGARGGGGGGGAVLWHSGILSVIEPPQADGGASSEQPRWAELDTRQLRLFRCVRRERDTWLAVPRHVTTTVLRCVFAARR